MNYYSVADPGDGPGLPLIIFDQTEARNKFFGDQAPQLYQGLDDGPPPHPPPPTPYLKVWIGNDYLPICTVIRSFHITTFRCFSRLLLLFSLFQYDLTYTMKYKQLLAVLMWCPGGNRAKYFTWTQRILPAPPQLGTCLIRAMDDLFWF